MSAINLADVVLVTRMDERHTIDRTSSKIQKYVSPYTFDRETYRVAVKQEIADSMILFMSDNQDVEKMYSEEFFKKADRVISYVREAPCGTILKPVCKSACAYGLKGMVTGAAVGGIVAGAATVGLAAPEGALVGGAVGYGVGFIYGLIKVKNTVKSDYEIWRISAKKENIYQDFVTMCSKQAEFEHLLDALTLEFPLDPVIGPYGKIYDISTVQRILSAAAPLDPFTREPVTKNDFHDFRAWFSLAYKGITDHMDLAQDTLFPNHREAFDKLKLDIKLKQHHYFLALKEDLDAQLLKGTIEPLEYSGCISFYAKELNGDFNQAVTAKNTDYDKGDRKEN